MSSEHCTVSVCDRVTTHGWSLLACLDRSQVLVCRARHVAMLCYAMLCCAVQVSSLPVLSAVVVCVLLLLSSCHSSLTSLFISLLRCVCCNVEQQVSSN